MAIVHCEFCDRDFEIPELTYIDRKAGSPGIKSSARKKAAIIIFEHEQRRIIKKFGAKKQKDWDELPIEIKNTWLEIVDQILSLDELAVVEREAQLPEPTAKPIELDSEYGKLFQAVVYDMKANIINDGWVKESNEE